MRHWQTMPGISGDEFPHAVFDALDMGLILIGSDHRVVAWNAWVASAARIGAEEAIGKTLEELFPQAKMDQLKIAVAAALKFGTSNLLTHSLHPALLPLTTRAGHVLIHDVIVRPVGQNAAVHSLIQISDVTVAAERDRVLRARQNARYDAVVGSAPDVILTLDADDTIQLANPATVRLFGYTSQELIGRPAAILFKDHAAWNKIRLAVLSGDAVPQPVELIAVRKDSSPSYLEGSLSRWAIESRVFITAILRDVNERRAAEAKLRASEEQFRSMAQAVPNHVWTALPDGMLDWFNDRVYEYSGTKPGMLDGQGWSTIVYSDDLAAVTERWAAAVASGDPYEVQFRLRRADGNFRWHLARATPVRGLLGEIARWVGSNTDIEDQKMSSQLLANLNETLAERVAERTLKLMQTEDALRQSQKMEAVGQLTGGIAHDFNNFLQGIIGALDRIQRRISEGRIEDVDRFLSGALESANRAAALTQRLLAFSRRQPLDPRPVNINQLIATVEDLLRRSIGEAINLQISSSDDLWPVRCDSNQLENAILNLAINARDAMPDGGTLRIEMSNKVLDEIQARQSDLTSGEFVCLRISDTGVGMTPAVKRRAFDPFFTTKPIGQGTGLGLSMIYGFVRQSDGAVGIDSEEGKGTTVEIYLPRHTADAAEAPDDQPQCYHGPGGDEVVLVVEDEVFVRDLIVEAIDNLGYQAIEAADGLSALRILDSSQRIDLLVSDIGLPGLNGRQLADAARVKRPGLKVLFMTGYAETAAGSSFLENGMEIISKPFMMNALASKLHQMVESGPR
ncbi:MAG TPA: PAS domain S-box protein [Methylocella sp.]